MALSVVAAFVKSKTHQVSTRRERLVVFTRFRHNKHLPRREASCSLIKTPAVLVRRCEAKTEGCEEFQDTAVKIPRPVIRAVVNSWFAGDFQLKETSSSCDSDKFPDAYVFGYRSNIARQDRKFENRERFFLRSVS